MKKLPSSGAGIVLYTEACARNQRWEMARRPQETAPSDQFDLRLLDRPSRSAIFLWCQISTQEIYVFDLQFP